MLKKNFLLSISLWSSLILSGCTTLQAPDVPICAEMALDRGRCTMTVSDKDITIDEQNLYDGKTWWELRPQMIYVPYPSWVEIKKFIIKVCKKPGMACDTSITSWDRKIIRIDENTAN